MTDTKGMGLSEKSIPNPIYRGFAKVFANDSELLILNAYENLIVENGAKLETKAN